jgi:hypothetical protein
MIRVPRALSGIFEKSRAKVFSRPGSRLATDPTRAPAGFLKNPEPRSFQDLDPTSRTLKSASEGLN